MPNDDDNVVQSVGSTILFDNDQSWGNGADINTVDRLRYQQRAVWPAYFDESAVPDRPPSFLTPNQDLGQGPIKPTSIDGGAHHFFWTHPNFVPRGEIGLYGPGGHGLIPAAMESDLQGQVAFGIAFQRFDLMIDASEFVELYGAAYGITLNEITSYSQDEAFDNSDVNISQYMKFRRALAAIYGLGVATRDPLAPLREFVDHTTEVPLLLTKAEKASSAEAWLGQGDFLGLVKPVYNYMLYDYEQVLESVVKPAAQTRVIPNIYVLTSELTNEEGESPDEWYSLIGQPERDFKQFVTVGNLIQGARPRLNQENLPGYIPYSQKNYFCKWTAAVDRLAPLDSLRSATTAERNFLRAGRNFISIIIPPDQLDFIKLANDQKEAYPMFNEIQFKTDGRKDFANLFIQSSFSSLIMRESMYAAPVPYNTYTRSFNGAHLLNPASAGDLGWFSTNAVLNPTELKTTDIHEFWNRIDNDGELLAEEQELLDDPFAIMLGAPGANRGELSNLSFFGADDEEKLRLRRLFKETFREKLNEICDNSTRSYSDMMGGSLARSETVFYRIEKRLNGQLVQEFYVPNNLPDGDLDIFRYVDTQVLYGKFSNADDLNVYDYRIYAGQLVIGSRYGRFALNAPEEPEHVGPGADPGCIGLPWHVANRDTGVSRVEHQQRCGSPPPWNPSRDDDPDEVHLGWEYDDDWRIAWQHRFPLDEEGDSDRFDLLPVGVRAHLGDLSLDSMPVEGMPRPSESDLIAQIRAIEAAELIGSIPENRATIRLLRRQRGGSAFADELDANRGNVWSTYLGALNAALMFARKHYLQNADRLLSPFPNFVANYQNPVDPILAYLENNPFPSWDHVAPGRPISRIGPWADPGSIQTSLRKVRENFQQTLDQIQALSPAQKIPENRPFPRTPGTPDPNARAVDSPPPPMDVEVAHFDDLGAPRPPVGGLDPTPAGTLQVKVKCLSYILPSVKLIQVPIFDAPDVAIFNKPPASPDIDIVPYRAIDNQALINMNEQTSTHRSQTPVFIENEDIDAHMFLTRSQYLSEWIDVDPNILEPLDIPIVFGNDDFPSSYEVYRIETPPESYADFAGGLHHIASLTDENGKPLASSASLIDALIPNRKYYYTFRIRDTHGQPSNPTDVYQVELVNDGSAVFMLFEVYNFPETPLNLVKDVRRYLKLAPAIAQSLVNMPRSGLLDESGEPSATAKNKTIHLGIPSPSTWGRKYKFRLMSKKTGRKIDINIDFKVNQIAEPDINEDSGCDPGFEAPPPQAPETPRPPHDDRRDEAGDFLVGAAPAGGDDIQVGLGGQAAAEPEPEPQSERDQHREAREEAEREEAIRRAADWDPNAGEWEDYE